MVFCDYDMDSVQKQLEELGLSANEVKVYMASLELGAATAQQLAAKAAVVRPTAYVAIGGLVKRGLMSSHTRGKKQFFQGERPEVLLSFIEKEKKRIVASEQKLKTIIPELHALISVAGARPEIGYYEGVEGLETMRAVLFAGKATELFVIGSPEKYAKSIPEESVYVQNVRLEKSRIKIKQIVLFDKKKPKAEVGGSTWRYLKVDKLESGEAAIFGDYVSLIVYLEKPYGFLLKSKEISQVLKKLFDAAWISSKVS